MKYNKLTMTVQGFEWDDETSELRADTLPYRLFMAHRQQVEEGIRASFDPYGLLSVHFRWVGAINDDES